MPSEFRWRVKKQGASLWRLALFIATALAPTYVCATPSVNVALSAAFNSPPYLVELLETAAEENSTCYFPLLDRVAEGIFADSVTEQDLYERFLQVLQDDGHITNADALSSFKLALSIRSTAPRIQAHYQYYNTSVEPSLGVAQDAVCQVWAHYDGAQYCSPSLEHAQQSVSGDSGERVLQFDRLLGEHDLPSLVLYADITAPSFSEFHTVLSKRAREGEFSYRVRYRPPASDAARKPLFVSGYGVELVLKRTDYIVIDDRDTDQTSSSFKEDGDIKPTLATDDDLKEEDTLSDLKPLSAFEVSRLGINAASFVMASDDPFDTLLKLSQDFPRHSSAIAHFNATPDFLEAFEQQNQALTLPPGYNGIWINGLQMSPRHIDAFSLVSHLRHERKLVAAFQELGLSARETVSLLSNPAITKSHGADQSPRFDYRDDLEGGSIIVWLNDLEKDSRYKEWPTSLSALLQRTYPGQLPNVRRDIHNVVLPMDLADPVDIKTVVSQIQRFVKKLIPVRFGLVPTLQSTESQKQAKVAHYLHEVYGLGALLAYLEKCLEDKETSFPSKNAFMAVIDGRTKRQKRTALSFEELLETKEYDAIISKTHAYLKRLGANTQPAPVFVNGAAVNRDNNWLHFMIARLSNDLESIQRGLLQGIFDDNSWIPQFYLADAVLGRHSLIVPQDPDAIKLLDMNELYHRHGRTFAKLPRIPAASGMSLEEWAQLIIIADFDEDPGLQQLREVLDFHTKHPGVEVLLLQNAGTSLTSSGFSTRLHELLQNSQELDSVTLSSLLKSVPAKSNNQEPSQNSVDDYVAELSPLIKSLGLHEGKTHLILNGRIIGPLDAAFDVQDLEQFLAFERKRRLFPVQRALSSLELADKISGPLEFARLTSLVALSTESDIPEGIYDSGPMLRSNRFTKLMDNKALTIATSSSENPSIEIVAAIDPTTELAQRWVPILKVLSQLDGVALNVFLNPRAQLQELPIKRFYRHVLDAAPTFDEKGSLLRPQATFKNLPDEALLTLGMDVPPSWLVASKESVHDLDNLKLSSLKPGMNVDAVYELEHILIEGHSRDVTTGTPPRGVQLLLGTEKNPHFDDTIIMANLGYFQFKAQPGYWKITLKPGQSERIFNLDSVGGMGYKPTPGDENNEVTLMSFQGTTLFPRLSRKPGHEKDDILEAGFKPGSPMDYLSKGLTFASGVLSSLTGFKNEEQHADINIFSVASGHLYERMLNIMMVSVMRHTKHSVKFWFIEQFLSPSFKSFLPHLAKEYGFSYEMVTYKWPHWLRAQREKQREIWGYKILFLDVLFPLSLDKVIFVDADQIVRTDMYELVTLDLEGAPYGFTPMCDSRTSMEGFRFWKQGYWEKFLRGLPYHISALYVVDLNRFRQLAAGDRLRGQYHQLSADPNSLSNLDQDLPNHMQHVIPIKSLPQDWLWCETWCSDEALTTAKTIDLCNNPLTKEPKLDRARRQVPEWTLYDEEIAALARRVAAEQSEEDMDDNFEELKAGEEEEAAIKLDRKDEL
ncbi:hypothetical protein VTO42DRAFT_965 [Malbranchea cinnamomea]